MTRYYNENPQVTLWRELAITSQNAARESQHIARKSIEEAEEWRTMAQKAIANASEANNLSKHLNNILDGYRVLFNDFNSLPWYRKIFYKFKL